MDTHADKTLEDAEVDDAVEAQDEDYDYEYQYEDDCEEDFCDDSGGGMIGESEASPSARKGGVGQQGLPAIGSAGSNSFNILLRDLPTQSTHYSELLSIFNCLRELIITSPLVIFLEWDYAHPTKFRTAILTAYGCRTGVGAYRFRIMFPSGPKLFFPEAPPTLVPLCRLPAASYIAICNHPLLCPKSWNPCQHIPILFQNLVGILDADAVTVGLEPCFGGSLDWPVTQSQDWALEALINLLCGYYLFSVKRFHHELNAKLSQLADTSGGIVLPCAPRLPSASSSATGTCSTRAAKYSTGIGYGRSDSEVPQAIAPSKSAQLVATIRTYLSRQLKRPTFVAATQCLWILCSPLPEMLIVLLNECSREEVDRERVYVEDLYTLAWYVDSFRSQCTASPTSDYTEQRHDAVGEVLRELYRRLVGFLAEELVEALSLWVCTIQTKSEIYQEIDPRFASGVGSSSSAPAAKAASSPTAEAAASLSATALSHLPDASSPPTSSSTAATTTATASASTGLNGKHSIFSGEEASQTGDHSSSSLLHTRVHHLSNLETGHSFSSTGLTQPSARWLRELRYIGDNLSEEITLYVCDEHPSYCRASMAIQNPDSPYYGGMFFFDIHVPPQYPQASPLVRFLTTAGGQVRFNPNLYADGKVCLSLLGTWTGEPWNPRTSNMTQVLQSILYLIFTDEPYYNEPGFERSRGTPAGLQASTMYNAEVFRHTVLWAVKEHLVRLERTPEVIRQVITGYYLEHWERSIKPVWEQRLAEDRWVAAGRRGEMRSAISQITASVQTLQANEAGRKKQKV